MGHITQDHLKQSRIAIPPLNLIESLHKVIDPILNKIVVSNEENQKLTELRDWLLPMLMNEQIKIKDAKGDPDSHREAMAAEPGAMYKKSNM